MKTKFQTKQRIVIVPLALSFAVALLLCSAVLAQTQLEPSPENPAGNTILIDDNKMNAVNYTNNGTIVGVENTPWCLDNRPGAAFSNAGTIDIYRSSLDYDIFDPGVYNHGAFTNETTGTINNYFSLEGTVDEGVFTNYGYINNQGGMTCSYNYGTIVNGIYH